MCGGCVGCCPEVTLEGCDFGQLGRAGDTGCVGGVQCGLPPTTNPTGLCVVKGAVCGEGGGCGQQAAAPLCPFHCAALCGLPQEEEGAGRGVRPATALACGCGLGKGWGVEAGSELCCPPEHQGVGV
jgi:hypothetical protein